MTMQMKQPKDAIPNDLASIINTSGLKLKYLAGRNDPALFVKYFLPHAWKIAKDYPKQLQYLREAVKAQEGILRAGSRSGKTYTMSMLITYMLFYRIRPEGTYYYNNYDKTYQILNAALTLNQAKLVLNNVVEMVNSSTFLTEMGFIDNLKYGQAPELTTCLNSRLDVRPTVHGGKHILGEYYDLINIDEAASEPDLNYLRHKTLGTRRADVSGRIFFTSTPQGASTFREVWFQMADRKKKGDKIALGIFEAYDNPVNSHSFLDDLKKTMTKGQIQEEVYGRFADFSNSYFNIGDILKAFKRGAESGNDLLIPMDDPRTGECLCESNNTNRPYNTLSLANHKYFTGVDVAGSGDDATVLITLDYYQDKLTMVAYERVSKTKLLGKAGVIERIKRRFTQYPGDIYFDSSSLGGNYLADSIEAELPKYIADSCTAISFVKKPGRSEHNHKKHMLNDLNKSFEQNILAFPETDETKVMKSELIYYQYEDIKLRQDTVMALALANYAYVRELDYNPNFEQLYDILQ